MPFMFTRRACHISKPPKTTLFSTSSCQITRWTQEMTLGSWEKQLSQNQKSFAKSTRKKNYTFTRENLFLKVKFSSQTNWVNLQAQDMQSFYRLGYSCTPDGGDTSLLLKVFIYCSTFFPVTFCEQYWQLLSWWDTGCNHGLKSILPQTYCCLLLKASPREVTSQRGNVRLGKTTHQTPATSPTEHEQCGEGRGQPMVFIYRTYRFFFNFSIINYSNDLPIKWFPALQRASLFSVLTPGGKKQVPTAEDTNRREGQHQRTWDESKRGGATWRPW